jgi:dTMP kinase
MWSDTSRFIVLEGLDGAGTTTQAAQLQDYFTKLNADSFLTREPTDGPIGKLLREILTGRLMRHRLAEREMALLFAADRLEHSRLVESKLLTSSHVVCDRYIFSSLAYQTLDPTITPKWVMEINAGFARPHLTLFLDVPVDECLRRISSRNESPTVYEKKDFLETIDQNYKRLAASYYNANVGPIVIIDGTAPPEDVHAAVMQAIESHLDEYPPPSRDR